MDNSCKSILNLDSLAFEDIQYKRDITKNGSHPEYELNFTKTISESDDGIHFKVSLSSNIHSKDNAITMSITLSALFSCQCEDENVKATLINENAIAILFPYLRSQVSLVTTQPSMSPIVIPPVNIVGLFNNSDNANQD